MKPTEAPKPEPKIELIEASRLRPYANNPRTHSREQVETIARSIVEFGWTNPILIDGDLTVIAGHGRLLAAQKLGVRTVPCVRLAHLTPAQVRAYVIADNQIALDAGWDDTTLRSELAALRTDGFDLSLTGFSESELADLLREADAANGEMYTRRIDAPVYTPKGEKPEVTALVDRSKVDRLVAEIEASGVPDAEKRFLVQAAQRHAVFDYHLIAEFYCHASRETQELMERSALVIIDFGKAIENGYVEMSEKMAELYRRSHSAEAPHA